MMDGYGHQLPARHSPARNEFMKIFRAPIASVMAIGALIALGQPARAATVQATMTNLASTSQRMISYRHQRHMIQTSDGYFHMMVNRGDDGTATALALQSSSGAGKKWKTSNALNFTGNQSVSDSLLVGNTLTVVYDCTDGFPRMLTLTYDPVAHTWGNKKIKTLPLFPGATQAVNPTLAVDGNGTTWLAYVAENTGSTASSTMGAGNSVIVLYGLPAGAKTWIHSGLQFGGNNNTYPIPTVKRSARLVAVAGGVGMVYTEGADMNWVGRPLAGDITTAWSAPKLLYTALGNLNEPMASHFSTITDALGNLFVAYTDQGALYLRERLASGGTWQARKTISPTTGDATKVAVYAQLSWFSAGKLALVTNYGSNARVYQSADDGANFVCTHSLQHATTDTNSYTDARVELPATATNPVPVVQQFIGPDTVTQGAIFYTFTQSTTAGCI
jgi:hypothetical protein